MCPPCRAVGKRNCQRMIDGNDNGDDYDVEDDQSKDSLSRIQDGTSSLVQHVFLERNRYSGKTLHIPFL